MSKTYKATGINLKGMPMGESDRLLTVLTPEVGLIRAIAPGARKAKSSLGGRSGLFVVNELLVVKGRSLDKIIQAQTIKSYPGLSRDLLKLTASQYLAELVLCQALTDRSQTDLYDLLLLHLDRLETSALSLTLPRLIQGIFHLLALAGIAPQVQNCCRTGKAIAPNFNDPQWKIQFNLASGGIVSEEKELQVFQVQESGASYQVQRSPRKSPQPPAFSLNANQLWILQHLAGPELPKLEQGTDHLWPSLENLLRAYAQYHFDRPIRAATLMEPCLANLPKD
ncbi:DNA repair protein RecO [Roseofilum reptotaenium CS-1145]|uniref:DNA repair protein RecO n=1 Tax=Roseofilum reptotaenium AO1-A TaxID=1925591 RepID=A0A1L9QVV3_9CYAN|nr:DNA repair protein RecO [Roseofilum reptotaenium]MDB9518101.1 DNA repair protein RecO [Roseofilum reptotaenium CS-1145]OJJ26821.1 DNA repair protein RecO [Roseofilum reptotaenium AO1-A]